MATQILTHSQPNINSKTHVENSPLTARQFGLILGRKAVACLLGELDPATLGRADLHAARAILGELLAETEAGFEVRS